jgi:hypothetical protein
MFEELKLLGATERSIVVQTRKGTPIDNLVEIEPGEPELRRYRLLLERFGQNWDERKPATGVYNCAGHVWASRRTSILAEGAWHTILTEDGYRHLHDVETPAEGDLVLYASEGVGGYLHVGMILKVQEGISQELSRIPCGCSANGTRLRVKSCTTFTMSLTTGKKCPLESSIGQIVQPSEVPTCAAAYMNA